MNCFSMLNYVIALARLFLAVFLICSFHHRSIVLDWCRGCRIGQPSGNLTGVEENILFVDINALDTHRTYV